MFSGPVLAAHQRYPDKMPTYHDCWRTNHYSTSRMKEEPYTDYTVVNNVVSEACPHPYFHATKDRKSLSQDMQHNTRCAEKLQGDQALARPLLSGLILGKVEQGGSLHGISQPLHVQMVLEQRRRQHMIEAPYNNEAAGHSQPVDGHKHEALTELQSSSAEGDRRMSVGMGVGVEFPVQAPYMSLNFQQVLGKHSSMKSLPFTTMSHISDSHSDHSKDMASYSCTSQSPSSSLASQSQREIPHYISTSVIKTNEK